MADAAAITAGQVEHLAELARIAMSSEELEKTAGDLDQILANVARVAEVATDDVPACVEAVRAAGYKVTDEPKEVVLAGNPVCIAFCRGGAGEIIEFFCEK